MSGALLLLAGAIFCRSYFSTQIGLDQMLLPQLAMGVALPFFFVPIVTTSLQFVPEAETSSAASVMNFMRTLAAAIATSIVVFTWSRETITKHAGLVEFQSQSMRALQGLARHGFSPGAALQTLDTLTWQQGMVLAANDVFSYLSLILVVAAAGIWLIPKSMPAQSPAFH
jgi:DHA2 family multidrug resistance protein